MQEELTVYPTTVIGLQPGNKDLFVRHWQEVNFNKISFDSKCTEETLTNGKKWYPYYTLGNFRKWYGNHEYVVNWKNDGEKIKSYRNKKGDLGARPQNTSFYFKEAISCSAITSSINSFRYCPKGFVFDVNTRISFYNEQDYRYIGLGYCNSNLVRYFSKILNPTLALNVQDVGNLPFKKSKGFKTVVLRVKDIIKNSKIDWDFCETSWDFEVSPMLSDTLKATKIKESYSNWEQQCRDNIAKTKELEEENNRLFIEAYDLQDELTPDVPEDEITLARADKEKDIKRLISYSVGCMMGRYSLDEKGLVYAHSANVGFDHTKYKTFPADEDGIVPITDTEWFDDDGACRFFRFIEVAWTKDALEENLEFIADAIGRKTNESSRDAIRRYFATGFFKDHLKTYKKRPIYWLFTSGKEKAFQVLVYLHRYNEGTLSRMRTEYVLPLQSKITARMEHLNKDKEHASSTSIANKMQKEIDKLRKQKEELLKFDEKLRHFADMKISLDLDDGVKVNYGKFGDLLAEVKAVTGK